MTAARAAADDTVSLLLSLGASPDMKNSNGTTIHIMNTMYGPLTKSVLYEWGHFEGAKPLFKMLLVS